MDAALNFADSGFYRIGGACAIAGALLAIVVNALHPDLPVPVREAHALIASRNDWRPLHFLIIAAAMLLSYGLAAFGVSCANARSMGWEQFGVLTTVVAAAVVAVAIGIDGFVEKALSDAWASAPPTQKSQYLVAATPVQLIHVGLFYVWSCLYWGVPFVFYGLAILCGRAYAAWFGWIAVTVGGLLTLAAIAQYIAPHDTVEVALRVLLLVLSLWVVIAGAFLWNKQKSAERLHSKTSA